MNKTLIALLATTGLAIGSAAFAADASYKSETKIEANKDGSYTKDVVAERKDAAGKVSTEVKTDVEVERDGTAEKTVITEHVNDPKGLFNKNKVKTKEEIKVDASGKATHEFKKTVNGDTVVDCKANTTVTTTGNTAAGHTAH